jgi:hypothetical protein
MDELLERLPARWILVAGTLAASLLGLVWWQERPIAHPSGMLTAAEPVQAEPESPATWTFRKHRMTPLARFEIRARVLARERYRFDRAAELSPVDFALGWGPMSDSNVLAALSIRQSDRWYFWSASELPLSPAEISSHSANMHMIPASEGVRNRLLSVRPGQVVDLRGMLVRADGQDGWHWISSLSRTDTGDGSCEVVWVDSIRVTDR